MSDYSPRIQPHSINAEQSVLGGILLDNPSYLTIAGLLNDHDFYREDHQLIFRAMKDMAADNQPIDVVTVSEWMQGRFLNPDAVSGKRSFFDVIGGLAYLGDLAKDTPSSANIAHDGVYNLNSNNKGTAELIVAKQGIIAFCVSRL